LITQTWNCSKNDMNLVQCNIYKIFVIRSKYGQKKAFHQDTLLTGTYIGLVFLLLVSPHNPKIIRPQAKLLRHPTF
jgi:hypothetical protein